MPKLSQKFMRSSLWAASGNALNAVVSLAVFVALARILVPEEFGTVAFAAIFVEIGRILSVGGVSDALVQKKEWEYKVANSAFWFNVCIALVFCVFMAISGQLIELEGSVHLAPVMMVLTLVVIVEASLAVPMALIRRAFGDRQIVFRNLVGNLIYGAVALGAALHGFGVWSLVFGRLTGSAVSAILLWSRSPFRPSLRPTMADFGRLREFAFHQTGIGLLNSGSGQAVPMIVGIALGSNAVAQYKIATRSLQLLSSFTVIPIKNTLLVGFSLKWGEQSDLGKPFLRALGIGSLLIVPAYLGFAVVAPDLVVLVFGQQWSLAGQLLQLLSLVVLPLLINTFIIATLSAMGNSKQALHITSFNFSLIVLSAIFASQMSVTTVAMMQAIAAHFSLLISLFYMSKHCGIMISQLIKVLAPATIGSMAMSFATVTLLEATLSDQGPLLRTIAAAGAGAAIYLVVLASLFPASLRKAVSEMLAVFSGQSARR